MRNLMLALLTLFSCSGAQAFWPEATDSSLEVGVGYRQDSLKWKTEADRHGSYYGGSNSYGSGSSYENSSSAAAGFRSKVDWKSLNIWQIEATGKYLTCDNVYFRAYGDYGWITSGKNSDKDYVGFGNGSNFTEISHTKANTSGHVYDANIAVGYQFQLCDNSFSFTPLVGYGWNGQHLKDKHLKFELVTDYILENPSEYLRSSYSSDYYLSNSSYGNYSYDSYYSSYSSGKCHSSYNARWNGPFIGFDFDYAFGCGCGPDWKLFGTYEFHWARYHSKGDWSLRNDCGRKFYQEAKNAYGNVFDIGVKWDLCDCWTVAVVGKFQWWTAKHGHDKMKIADLSLGDFETKCYLSQPLKDVKWTSAGISFDVGMSF
jgi:hypothetical protein